METKEQLGKICDLSFGFGGYQDAMFGVTFSLGGDGWGIGDFWGTWASPPSDTAKWTVKDQSKTFDEVYRDLMKLCRDAKVQSIDDLKGVPIRMVMENRRLKSWEILKEVI